MKKTTTVLRAILAAGGLRADSPEAEEMVVAPLAELDLVEFVMGPAHGPRGTYYVTALGCRVAAGRAKVGRVPCPDCDGEGKIEGGPRCVMCAGRGEFSADHARALCA